MTTSNFLIFNFNYCNVFLNLFLLYDTSYKDNVKEVTKFAIH